MRIQHAPWLRPPPPPISIRGSRLRPCPPAPPCRDRGRDHCLRLRRPERLYAHGTSRAPMAQHTAPKTRSLATRPLPSSHAPDAAPGRRHHDARLPRPSPAQLPEPPALPLCVRPAPVLSASLDRARHPRQLRGVAFEGVAFEDGRDNGGQ